MGILLYQHLLLSSQSPHSFPLNLHFEVQAQSPREQVIPNEKQQKDNKKKYNKNQKLQKGSILI
jgi:hypothetical protein